MCTSTAQTSIIRYIIVSTTTCKYNFLNCDNLVCTLRNSYTFIQFSERCLVIWSMKNSKLPNFHRNDVLVNFHITEYFTSFTEVQLLFLMSATPYITYKMLANNLHLPYTKFAINIHTKCPLVAYIAIQHITTPFYPTITTASGLNYMGIYALTNRLHDRCQTRITKSWEVTWITDETRIIPYLNHRWS
jgi:hypothetical protein